MLMWLSGAILLAVALAVAYLGILVLCESRKPRVICLMYHRLAPRDTYAQAKGTERIFTVPVEEFERQIAYLKERGYTFVSPEMIEAFVAQGMSLPDRSVLITFDDGCHSFAEWSVPILEKYGAQATVFVTTDPHSYVFGLGEGNDPRLSDDELRRLDPRIVQVGAHGVTHRALSGLTQEDILSELQGAKNELENLLSRDVCYCAVPGNWFDHRVMQIAQRVGYTAVWCSNPGSVRAGSDLFGLPRVNIEGPLTLSQFGAALSPFGIAQRRIVSRLKRAPGRLLGPRCWLPLRRVLLRCLPGGHLSNRRIIAIGCVLVGIVFLLSLILLLYCAT